MNNDQKIADIEANKKTADNDKHNQHEIDKSVIN